MVKDQINRTDATISPPHHWRGALKIDRINTRGWINMRSVPSKPTVSLIISIRKQERLIQTKFTINYTTLYLAFYGQKTQNSFLANYTKKIN